ncbi:Glycosyltransferase involved in cell wall bisynthesis [Oscillospiraceae bacterium]|nr:Glycosyltransferase involved in cell wall bisynthesis [Oscillospiraceae bacterium]
MISIVVPVYNIEDYLRKCLDSIINQTYKDLDIILIDDGSTDSSGKICDEYGAKDNRVRVFHIENNGVSAARNFGAKQAVEFGSQYVGFIDSDDWIDLDMCEFLLNLINKNDADVASCSIYREFPNNPVIRNLKDAIYTGEEAPCAVVDGGITDSCCDKLWNTRIWKEYDFPTGRVYEDYATVYKALEKADKIVVSSEPKYHYLCRPNSILQSHDIEKMVNLWVASKERYLYLKDRAGKDTLKKLIYDCAYSVGRLWSWAWEYRDDVKIKYSNQFADATSFTRELFPSGKKTDLGLSVCIGVFFAKHNNRLSYFCIYLMNQFRRIGAKNKR